ncbi:MAG: ComEA family DNA-binding protein [Thermoanaerobaculia bacterium]
MRKSQTIAIVSLVILSICGAAFADTQTAAAPAGVVNINTADAAQLSNLPRVGIKVAQRIVDYRTAHGPFARTSDLMQVKGFGQKSFERISSYLTVEGKTTLSAKIQKPRKARASKSMKQPSNTASR